MIQPVCTVSTEEVVGATSQRSVALLAATLAMVALDYYVTAGLVERNQLVLAALWAAGGPVFFVGPIDSLIRLEAWSSASRSAVSSFARAITNYEDPEKGDLPADIAFEEHFRCCEARATRRCAERNWKPIWTPASTSIARCRWW